MRHGCRPEEVDIAAVGQKQAAAVNYILVSLRHGDAI